MTIALPDWLKTAALVCYLPERTIFEPQRRIVFRNGVACLLDCCEQTYPLAQCDRLRLDHLNGVALWVTEGRSLTIFRLTARSDEIAVTDGKRRAIVRLPLSPPKPDARKAAESLAQFFNGTIVEGL
jgi:hypothetical protein